MSELLILILIVLLIGTILPLVLHGTTYLDQLTRKDIFLLIPHWKMFVHDSPGLSQYDYYILYRDKLADNSLTDWQELVTANKHWSKFIWNPSFTGSLLNYQYSYFLMNELTNFYSTTVNAETVFQHLAKAILKEPKLSPASKKRQFSIVKKDMSLGSNDNIFKIDSDYYDF